MRKKNKKLLGIINGRKITICFHLKKENILFLSLIILFQNFLFIISKYCTEIDLNNFPYEKLLFKTSMSFFAKKMEVVRVLVVVGLVLGMLVEPSASLSECQLTCLLMCGNSIPCQKECEKNCGVSSTNINLHTHDVCKFGL